MTHRYWIGPHKVTLHSDYQMLGLGIDLQWPRCSLCAGAYTRFLCFRAWFLFWLLAINFNEGIDR